MIPHEIQNDELIPAAAQGPDRWVAVLGLRRLIEPGIGAIETLTATSNGDLMSFMAHEGQFTWPASGERGLFIADSDAPTGVVGDPAFTPYEIVQLSIADASGGSVVIDDALEGLTDRFVTLRIGTHPIQITTGFTVTGFEVGNTVDDLTYTPSVATSTREGSSGNVTDNGAPVITIDDVEIDNTYVFQDGDDWQFTAPQLTDGVVPLITRAQDTPLTGTITAAPPATAPDPFTDAMVSVADSETNGFLTYTLSDAPADGGSPITGIEWSDDNEVTWTDSGLTTAQIDALTVTPRDVEIQGVVNQPLTVVWRAVNAVGAGDAGPGETGTPFTPPSVSALSYDATLQRFTANFTDAGEAAYVLTTNTEAEFDAGSDVFDAPGAVISTVTVGSNDIALGNLNPGSTYLLAVAARDGDNLISNSAETFTFTVETPAVATEVVAGLIAQVISNSGSAVAYTGTMTVSATEENTMILVNGFENTPDGEADDVRVTLTPSAAVDPAQTPIVLTALDVIQRNGKESISWFPASGLTAGDYTVDVEWFLSSAAKIMRACLVHKREYRNLDNTVPFVMGTCTNSGANNVSAWPDTNLDPVTVHEDTLRPGDSLWSCFAVDGSNLATGNNLSVTSPLVKDFEIQTGSSGSSDVNIGLATYTKDGADTADEVVSTSWTIAAGVERVTMCGVIAMRTE